MKYRLDRYGNQISQLGYGCMRFSRKGNGIDYEKAEREVLLASAVLFTNEASHHDENFFSQGGVEMKRPEQVPASRNYKY